MLLIALSSEEVRSHSCQGELSLLSVHLWPPGRHCPRYFATLGTLPTLLDSRRLYLHSSSYPCITIFGRHGALQAEYLGGWVHIFIRFATVTRLTRRRQRLRHTCTLHPTFTLSLQTFRALNWTGNRFKFLSSLSVRTHPRSSMCNRRLEWLPLHEFTFTATLTEEVQMFLWGLPSASHLPAVHFQQHQCWQ